MNAGACPQRAAVLLECAALVERLWSGSPAGLDQLTLAELQTVAAALRALVDAAGGHGSRPS